MSTYAHVLAPGRIGSLELANRLVMAPVTTRLAHPDGTVSNREIAFHTARARGGAGLLVTGAMLAGTDLEPPRSNVLRIDDDRFVTGLARLVDAVHRGGARIGAQLTPGLGRVGIVEQGRTVVSASPTPTLQAPEETCRALTTDEVRLLVRRFGEAAARAAAAGFDLIDVHGHTGHLLDQFLTSAWNQRTDEYGGSLENRCRLAVELVEAARAGAPGLPVSFRLSTVHHVLGGRDVEESLEVARVLQSAGVDLLVVDEGAQETPDRAFPPYYLGDAPALASAAAMRKVLRIPVMVTGNMTPQAAEKAMADGEIDFVGIGRGLVADPDLPRKLVTDRPGSVRPCIRCNACLDEVSAGRPIVCAVNPQVGAEAERQVVRSHRSKRVVVVGGGPAGLETARVAALRGHTVDLYERAGRLGGVLWPAARPEFKRELRGMVAWWTTELARLGVTVHLNWEISAGSPALNAADEVVVATGALPTHPLTVTGLDRGETLDALEVHRGAVVGNRVVVAGGGLSGADLALELALAGHEVVLLEQEDAIARDVVPANRLALLRRLDEAGVDVRTRHSVRAVDRTGVLAHTPHGGAVRLTADTVVTALGMRSNAMLTGRGVLEDPRVHVVGDCVEPGTVGDAVHAAFEVAAAL